MDNGDSILGAQNETDSIEMLAAQRQLYSEEKRLLIAQLGVAVISSSVAFGVVTFLPKHTTQANSLAGICVFLDICLQYAMGQKKKQAAQVQESFDCKIFRLPQAIDEKPRAEVLIAAADRHPQDGRDSLKGWYLGDLNEVPFRIARVVCQMTNVTYDDSVRNTYIRFLGLLLVILVIGPLLYGVACSVALDKIFSDIFLPTSPMTVFLALQLKEHKTAIARLQKLREQVEQTWEICLGEENDGVLDEAARKLQNKIFSSRADSAPVFDEVYKFCRPKQEIHGKALANKLIAEYKQKKGL